MAYLPVGEGNRESPRYFRFLAFRSGWHDYHRGDEKAAAKLSFRATQDIMHLSSRKNFWCDAASAIGRWWKAVSLSLVMSPIGIVDAGEIWSSGFPVGTCKFFVSTIQQLS